MATRRPRTLNEQEGDRHIYFALNGSPKFKGDDVFDKGYSITEAETTESDISRIELKQAAAEEGLKGLLEILKCCSGLDTSEITTRASHLKRAIQCYKTTISRRS